VRYLGVHKADLPGKPYGGQVLPFGPLWLVRYRSPLAYDSLRVGLSPEGPWRPVAAPAYRMPDPRQYPPGPDQQWPGTPLFIRGELDAAVGDGAPDARLLLGFASPVIATWVPQATIRRFVVNGREAGPPWLERPYLTLFDVTRCLRNGKGDFLLEIEGPTSFVLDLFAVAVGGAARDARQGPDAGRWG